MELKTMSCILSCAYQHIKRSWQRCNHRPASYQTVLGMISAEKQSASTSCQFFAAERFEHVFRTGEQVAKLNLTSWNQHVSLAPSHYL